MKNLRQEGKNRVSRKEKRMGRTTPKGGSVRAEIGIGGNAGKGKKREGHFFLTVALD